MNSTFLYCFQLLSLFFCQSIMPNWDTIFENWSYERCIILKELIARESGSLKLFQKIKSAGDLFKDAKDVVQTD